MAAVEFEHLSYCYSEQKPPALQNICLRFAAGTFTSIAGRNNSGKSTLCYAVAGVIPHLFHGKISGKVKINGEDNAQQTVGTISNQVGLVLQKPDTQISGMRFTVFEEVALGLENRGVARDTIKQKVAETLQLMELSCFAEQSPFHLSGGQQQRLALASVLVAEPSIVVLDEPTTFLDPQGAVNLFTLLKNLQNQGKTIIITEQRTDLLASFSDRTVIIDEGKVIRDGSPGEVLTQPELENLGIARTRYTRTAELAREKRLWQGERPLPATLSAARDGLIIKEGRK